MEEVFQLKLSLKKIVFSKYRPVIHYKKFIRFLRLQKNSLTNLVLDCCTDPKFGIEIIHQFVLKNLKNLKHFLP